LGTHLSQTLEARMLRLEVETAAGI